MYAVNKNRLAQSIMAALCLSSMTTGAQAEIGLRVVVDNKDAAFTTTGEWYESGADGEFRQSSVYAVDSAKATWTAALPESGQYKVQVRWTYWNNRARNAPYTVNHLNGSSTIRVDQRNIDQGGVWVKLGIFDFDAGNATVELLREEDDGVTTSADAVRFIKVDELAVQPPPPPPPEASNESEFIKVDQLGYQSGMRKIAVIANPKQGFNVPASAYTPGSTFEVRKVVDDSVAYSGILTAWNNGATDAQSGDQVWHFDFSALQEAGSYYVYDPQNGLKSYAFEVAANPYQETLKAAVKTYFYQRAGMEKLATYAGAPWADAASHLGAEMDDDCRAINPANPEQSDPTTSLDLSGGWYDAGDFNKYVNFADGVLHELLFAYEENQGIWGDDWNLPESGNAVPDVLDEIRYELDWLLKMQQADGGVLHKVSSISWDFAEADPTDAPSKDRVPRRYAPVTASATISAAGAFAHAAKVFAAVDPLYATQLQTAAQSSWLWLESHSGQIPSSYDNAGFMNVAAEDSARAQASNRLNAAMYLHVLTGEQSYQDYINANKADARLLSHDAYLQYDGQDYESQNALLYYAAQANTDSALAADIHSAFLFNLENPWVDFAPKLQAAEQTDGYLAYLDGYSWGSNRGKGQAGNTLAAPAAYSLSTDAAELLQDAGQFLHYLHGVNPMSQFYLSNMADYGVEKSADQFYHMWFRDGSLWDSSVDSYGPPPGFLVGGPNEFYDVPGVTMSAGSTAEIQDQPAAKKYRSWNTLGDAQVYDHESYRISENSITYQAAYIRLLSKFVQ